MDFWSKGLGKRTVGVDLAESDVTKSGDVLYLRGTMEEPITWDYIMRLRSDDVAEFMALLRDPRVADFVWDSPQRWQLFRRLLGGGLVLVWLVLVAFARSFFVRGAVEEPEVQLPPPIERKRPATRERRTRRRLTSTDARLSVTGERTGPRSAPPAEAQAAPS